MEGKAQSFEYMKNMYLGLGIAGGTYALPGLAASGTFSSIGQGFRLYHTTFGMRGRYLNTFWNYGIQSGQKGSFNPSKHNLFGYLGSAFTGPSIYSQSIIGGSSGLINYTPSDGLKGVWNRPVGVSSLDVINGIMAPVYGLGGPAVGFIGGSSHLIFGGRVTNYLEDNYPLRQKR